MSMYFMNCLCIPHCLHSVLALSLLSMVHTTQKFMSGSVSRSLLFQNACASEDKGL